MKTVSKTALWLTSLISVVSLSGCAGSAIPEKGLTVEQIYSQATHPNQASGFQGGTLNTVRSKIKQIAPAQTQEMANYTQMQTEQMNNLFKPLPNPQIPLYVFPHLIQQGGRVVGVPGYTTSFFLFTKARFATPEQQY